ncbi:unnamed protein product, partial [Dicrocoelium dendriticum]
MHQQQVCDGASSVPTLLLYNLTEHFTRFQMVLPFWCAKCISDLHPFYHRLEQSKCHTRLVIGFAKLVLVPNSLNWIVMGVPGTALHLSKKYHVTPFSQSFSVVQAAVIRPKFRFCILEDSKWQRNGGATSSSLYLRSADVGSHL